MVESKFVIVTTLCYFGIAGVIFFVCCCAWTRHRRKGHRGFHSQQRNSQTRRQFHRPVQPPQYHTPSTPVTYSAPRPGTHFEDEMQNRTEGNTYYHGSQRYNAVDRNNLYPQVNVRYQPDSVFAGYPGGNLYTSVNITTGMHAEQMTTRGETNTNLLQGRSIENCSEESSRFDGNDSVLADTDDKNSISIASSRKRSGSLNSDKEVESDSVSSGEASHFQEISPPEERCQN